MSTEGAVDSNGRESVKILPTFNLLSCNNALVIHFVSFEYDYINIIGIFKNIDFTTT